MTCTRISIFDVILTRATFGTGKIWRQDSSDGRSSQRVCRRTTVEKSILDIPGVLLMSKTIRQQSCWRIVWPPHTGGSYPRIYAHMYSHGLTGFVGDPCLHVCVHSLLGALNVLSRHVQCVDWLLSRGADVLRKDDKGLTARDLVKEALKAAEVDQKEAHEDWLHAVTRPGPGTRVAGAQEYYGRKGSRVFRVQESSGRPLRRKWDRLSLAELNRKIETFARILQLLSSHGDCSTASGQD